MSLTLDYSYMLSPPVANGVPEDELRGSSEILAAARARFADRMSRGELGFLALPDDARRFRDCEDLAAKYTGRLDDVVVLGIGGSALGATALRTALLAPMWNLLDASSRSGLPRLHVLDNVDPGTVAALLRLAQPVRTLFLVISKSGSTAETMAQYLIVRRWLQDALGNRAIERLVFLTDPARGALRAIATEEGIPSLEVPPDVGGRFSVLSPVGMFPALLTGMDARSLLRGAAIMRDRCLSSDILRNPAAMYAFLQWLADSKRGARIHAFMPYSDAMRDFAHWFVQLWAESLGKMAAAGEPRGPTPLPAVGATDQHSQVQLFMEGPLDKTVTFVSVQSRSDDMEIPAQGNQGHGLSYLAGHTLAELLDFERRATAGALAARGRPSMTIEMPAVDAYHVGELIMMLEIATVIAGELYGVDPLDQPGVELGKGFTSALLGKEGSERAMSEWQRLPRPDPSRLI